MQKTVLLIAAAAVSLICDSAVAQPRCGFPALSPVCFGPGVTPRSPSSASSTSEPIQTTAKFIFKSFDVPGAGTGPFQGTVTSGILPNGAISGGIYDTNGALHAFVRALNGSITTFDAPGVGTGANQGTFAWAINPQGATTGSAIDPSSTYHGFLRSPGSTFTVFDAPGAGTENFLGTHGFNINDNGEIAGNYRDASDVWHAFVRTPNGAITAFDAPGAGNGPGQGTFYSYFNFQAFYALNSAGTYTSGYVDAKNVLHAFLRSPNGAITTFDAPNAGKHEFQGTVAFSINPTGEIAGNYTDAKNVMYGFVRAPGGTFTTFAVPGQGTGEGQGAVVFNNNLNGAVAGLYLDAKFVMHGFVRAPGGTFTTFDAPGADTVDAYYGTVVTGLNPAGLLAGYVIDGNSVYRAYVAIPAIFAGTPGYTNCPGQSVAAITTQYGGLPAGAAALSFPDVQSMLDAIQQFCGQ
jgi:hypothetical protein